MNLFFIFYFISITSGLTEVQKMITKSLIDHFHIKHCILVSSTENKISTFNDFKLLSYWNIVSNVKSPIELHRYINKDVFPWITPSSIGTKWEEWDLGRKLLMPKTLVIIENATEEYISKLFYSSYNDQTAGYFTWAGFFEKFDEKFLRPIEIPYNTEFLVVKKESSTTYKLSESYSWRGTPFLINYGTWDREHGLRETRPDLSFYERRLNMKQTKIYLYETRKKNGDILHSYHSEILEDYKKMMNFTIERAKESPDGGFTINDLSYIMSDSTYEKDAVSPVLKVKSFMYIKEPEFTKSKIYFLLPLSASFWYALLSFLILSTLVNILIHFIFNCKYSEENIEWIDSAFKAFDTFCNQSGGNQSKLNTSRAIAYTIHLSAIIIISAYSAVLYSRSTINISRPPFQNLKELVQDQQYSLGVIGSGYEDWFFRLHRDPFYRNIYKNMLKNNPVKNIKAGLERVCNEKHAQIALEFDVRRTPVNCKVFQIKEPVMTWLTSFRFYIYSCGIKEAFAYKLHWFYSSGIIHKLEKKLKDFHEENLLANYSIVEMNQILYVMAIIIIGALLALIIFLTELIFNFLLKLKLKSKFKFAKIIYRNCTKIRYYFNK